MKILQIMPAPQGLRLLFRSEEPPGFIDEPPACLALCQVGNTTGVKYMEVVEGDAGDLLLADDNPDFVGAFWGELIAPLSGLLQAREALQEAWEKAQKDKVK